MKMRSIIFGCIAAYSILMLPACSTGPFSGSAAMRIEVEVYKGPLSLEPEIQLGELRGYVREAYSALVKTNEFTASVARSRDFTKFPLAEKIDETNITSSTWCGDVAQFGIFQQFGYFDCQLLQSMFSDTILLLDRLALALDSFPHTSPSKHEAQSTAPSGALPSGNTSSSSFSTFQQQNKEYATRSSNYDETTNSQNKPKDLLKEIRLFLEETNHAAASLQSAAFRYATAQTAGQSLNFKVRIATTNFIVIASEYSNQISSRVDALMKQLGNEGRDRRELPLSVHLREAEPTDFVHLYKWMDATSNSFLNYFIIGSGSVDERIKIIDRLYANHFWSKINTVYASGRGKTQMAFVKDETGNWNLKGYDNDPSELLDAYTNVAKTALDGAVKVTMRLAKGGASGGGSELSQQLLAIADQTALAKPSQPAQSKGTLSLDNLRDRIAGQLNSAQAQGDITKDNDLVMKVGAAKDALETATKAGKTSEADQARSDLEKANTNLSKHRKDAISRLTALVDDHSNLVDMLGSTIKKK